MMDPFVRMELKIIKHRILVGKYYGVENSREVNATNMW